MGRVPYSEFVGARARFQRLSDQRVFSGWLKSLENESVLVTAEDTLPPGPAERFLFQVQGQSADAYFIATSSGVPVGSAPYVHGAIAEQLVDIKALNYKFELITHIQMRDAQQIARKAIGSLVAKVNTRGKVCEVLVADASAGGMGVIAWEELERGDVVQVDVKAQDIDASLTCEVRHCRPEQRLIGAYRVGLQFKNADRLAQIAWRKLINPI